MKAEELRIGNIVRDRKRRVIEIDSHGLSLLEKWELIHYSKSPPYSSIPLIEEWLLKFGFAPIEERLYCKRWRLNRVDIYKMISGNYPFYFRFNQVDLKIKYVHQLQNLYFALIGEELKINL